MRAKGHAPFLLTRGQLLVRLRGPGSQSFWRLAASAALLPARLCVGSYWADSLLLARPVGALGGPHHLPLNPADVPSVSCQLESDSSHLTWTLPMLVHWIRILICLRSGQLF